MSNLTSLMQLWVFVLAAFVGYQVITRVPALLHTPLMSAAKFHGSRTTRKTIATRCSRP
jgi:NAD(P) transhydrogenase subunit alpha